MYVTQNRTMNFPAVRPCRPTTEPHHDSRLAPAVLSAENRESTLQQECIAGDSTRKGSREGPFLDTQGYGGIWCQNCSASFRDWHSAAGSFQMRIFRTGCCGRVDRDGDFLLVVVWQDAVEREAPWPLAEIQDPGRLSYRFDLATWQKDGGGLLRPLKTC